MKVETLSVQTAACLGFTHRVEVTYADLSGTSDTQTLELISVPAGTAVLGAGFKLVTPFDFSDAAINACGVEVGDGSDPNRFIVSTETALDGTEIDFWVTANTTATLPYAYNAADTIDALFTVAGGASPDTGEATAGEIHIFLRLADLNGASQRIS